MAVEIRELLIKTEIHSRASSANITDDDLKKLKKEILEETQRTLKKQNRSHGFNR